MKSKLADEPAVQPWRWQYDADPAQIDAALEAVRRPMQLPPGNGPIDAGVQSRLGVHS